MKSVLSNNPTSISNFISKSGLSVSYLVFKTNPLVPILFTLASSLSYLVFLTISLSATLLSLLKSAGTVSNLSTSVLSTLVFKFAKFDFSAIFSCCFF